MADCVCRACETMTSPCVFSHSLVLSCWTPTGALLWSSAPTYRISPWLARHPGRRWVVSMGRRRAGRNQRASRVPQRATRRTTCAWRLCSACSPVAVSQLLPVLTVVFGVRLGCAWLGSVPDDNWDNGEDGGGWDMAGDADGEAAPQQAHQPQAARQVRFEEPVDVWATLDPYEGSSQSTRKLKPGTW